MTLEEFVVGYMSGKRRVKATGDEGSENGTLMGAELTDAMEIIDNGMIGFLADDLGDPSDDLQRECGLEQIEWIP